MTRTHIELYVRELEELGRVPATIGRRRSTVAGFYRYAAEEGVIDHSPAVHVRRPKLDYESYAVGLDRNELGAFLVAAGLSSARDHALCSLLALNGLARQSLDRHATYIVATFVACASRGDAAAPPRR